MLLLLNNLEHLSAAGTLLIDLLGGAPGLTLLVTSRALPRVSGEQVVPVPPLALPDPGPLPSAASLKRFGVVRLFLDRARAVRPAFVVDGHNAGDVVAICRRLDGLPLAVGGVALVCAASRLGEPVLPFLGQEFVVTLPGLFSTDADTSTAALERFLGLTTLAELPPRDRYLALGYNSVVPPRVRQALLSRTLSHDDLLERLTLPVLLAHGVDDQIVLPSMSEHHARLIPHAKSCWYEQVGHSPFLEVPDRFNADLREFASSL